MRVHEYAAKARKFRRRSAGNSVDKPKSALVNAPAQPGTEQGTQKNHVRARSSFFAIAFVLGLAAVCVRSAAATPSTEEVIAATFDISLYSSELDLNVDGQISAPDIFVAQIAEARNTPTPIVFESPSATPTRRPPHTPTPTATGTVTHTATFTPSPLPTFTPTNTATPTPLQSATPNGLIYAGPVDDLAPHGLGDTFIYNVTTSSSMTTQTVTVTASASGSFTLNVVGNGKNENDGYTDDGTNIYYISELDFFHNPSTLTTCNMPMQGSSLTLRLTSPMFAGDIFMSSVTCSIHIASSGLFLGSFDLVESFKPIEILPSMQVPAGTYSPVVHLHASSTLGTETSEVYLSPGIGIIERDVTSPTNPGTQYQLMDGTVGGQSVKR